MLNYRLANAHIWRNLEQIRIALGRSHAEMAELLGLHNRSYHKNRALGRAISAANILVLAQETSLSLEEICVDRLRLDDLNTRIGLPPTELPEHFSQGFSRRRTSFQMLHFIDHHFGKAFSNQMLKSIGVSRSCFKDLEATNSVQLPNAICHYLIQSGAPPTVIVKMGAQSSSANSGSPLALRLSTCKSLNELYDLQINGMMHLFEKNYHYRTTQLTSKYCVIESIESEDATTLNRGVHLGSSLTCLSRQGVAASFPAYLGLPHAQVRETRCVHLGDSICRFEVDYEFAHHIWRKRKAA